MNKTRDSRFELLRIISMLFIVICHSFLLSEGLRVEGDYHFEYISNNFFIATVAQWLASFGRLGNEIFVLISSYFLVTSKSNPLRILKTSAPVHFYCLSLLVVQIITSFLGQQDFNSKTALKMAFPILLETYWFVGPFIALVFLHPYLNLVLKKITQQQLLILVSFLILVTSIIPTFTLKLSTAPGFHDLGIFITLYLIAGLIRRSENNMMFKRKWLVLLFLLGTFSQLANIILVDALALKLDNPRLLDYANYLNGQESIFLMISAVSILILFSYAKPFYNSFINAAASTTFGIYLIHTNQILLSIIFKNPLINSFIRSSYYLLLIIAYSVFLFSICSLIEYSRLRIIGNNFEISLLVKAKSFLAGNRKISNCLYSISNALFKKDK